MLPRILTSQICSVQSEYDLSSWKILGLKTQIIVTLRFGLPKGHEASRSTIDSYRRKPPSDQQRDYTRMKDYNTTKNSHIQSSKDHSEGEYLLKKDNASNDLNDNNVKTTSSTVFSPIAPQVDGPVDYPNQVICQPQSTAPVASYNTPSMQQVERPAQEAAILSYGTVYQQQGQDLGASPNMGYSAAPSVPPNDNADATLTSSASEYTEYVDNNRPVLPCHGCGIDLQENYDAWYKCTMCAGEEQVDICPPCKTGSYHDDHFSYLSKFNPPPAGHQYFCGSCGTVFQFKDQWVYQCKPCKYEYNFDYTLCKRCASCYMHGKHIDDCKKIRFSDFQVDNG